MVITTQRFFPRVCQRLRPRMDVIPSVFFFFFFRPIVKPPK